jgi:hypothetical protein
LDRIEKDYSEIITEFAFGIFGMQKPLSRNGKEAFDLEVKAERRKDANKEGDWYNQPPSLT